jgi:hypothetical protein
MSLVGAFPGMNDFRKRTIRGPVNPLDKSTVVSIYPKYIDEEKVTIQPGRFIIQPGSIAKPTILVVGPSSWWREIDEEQPLLEIPTSSIQIADAIVRDYCSGLLACNMGDSMPGMFYVPGEHDVPSLLKSYSAEFAKAKKKQEKLWSNLVQLADMLWARSNGNPMAISEDMRIAARELNLTSVKDWMKDFTMVNMVRCKACGSLKNPEFPICATCRFPDPDHPMTKQLMEMAEKLPKGT